MAAVLVDSRWEVAGMGLDDHGYHSKLRGVDARYSSKFETCKVTFGSLATFEEQCSNDYLGTSNFYQEELFD